MILALYFLGTMIVFGMGLAAFFAALQVYFRDTSQLPAVLRPDLDVPVPGAVAARARRRRLPRWMQTLIELNPMYSMLGGYADAACRSGGIPPTYMWISAAAWAVGAAVDRLLVLHLEGA